ncbi:mucin-5AC-like isoform X9 [Cyprinodon tularosa]|uniref:mucin-5AC-like isoform X9 n=1 Tax=Cyprinodon tularosa TaxID=77115 RepID=UPI0018E2343F|nr:mucin-5AC-like isoform X9 [Cyprinodon tularosa]
MELYMFLLLLAGLIGTGTAQSTTTATTVTTGSTSGGTSATQTSTQPGTTAVTTGSTSGGTSATQTSTQPGTTAVTTGSTSGETSATQTSTQPGTTAVTTGSTSGGTSATQTSTQPGTTAVTTGSTSGETSAKQTSTQPGTTASTTTTTTAAPTTTTTRRPPPPPEPKIELQFSVQETFSEDLKDETSPRFIELKGEVTKGLDKTYRDQFGDEFNRTEVRGFRQGSIIVDAELIFNNITTLPNTSDVTETLKNATTSNAFNFTVNTQSISARVAPPPTTAAPTTATPSATSNMTANSTATPMSTTSNMTTNSTTPTMTTTSNMTTNSTTPPMTTTSNMTTNSTQPPATANSTTSPANGTSAQPHNQTTPTTQVPVTTMMTTVPADSRVRLGFSLDQQFESGLENPQSSVFRNLADRLEIQLFNSFRRRFRFLLRVLILRFRPGSIQVDSELQFPNASAVPEPRAVENALVEEANTSSNFTLVPGSVVVTRANETTNSTTPPMTATSNMTANSTTSPMTATSNMTANSTTPPMTATSNMTANSTTPPMTATSNMTANSTTPPMTATLNMTANSTTPPMTATSNMTANSTTPPMTTTSNMTTNSTTTPATANSTTSPANGTSAQPHNQTTPTTQVPVTTMMTTVPADSRLRLGFRLNQTFESGLENPQSSVFRNLADRLERQLFNSFRRRFRFLLRVLILRFSQGSVVVDSELQFPNASSVPEPREVENALVEEANTSSNLTLVPGSVVVTRANETTNTTANSTTATTTTAANSTTASATTTSGSTGPPTGSEGSLSIRFSLNRTFIPALATSGSPEFIELASTVVKEINRICKILFSGFLRSLVNSFTEGSVVTNMTLVFRDASSVPDLNTAQSQLASALLTSNVLNYINGSLVVEPTTTSSSPPQPTLGGLTIFSLTMLAVAQMLINS